MSAVCSQCERPAVHQVLEDGWWHRCAACTPPGAQTRGLEEDVPRRRWPARDTTPDVVDLILGATSAYDAEEP